MGMTSIDSVKGRHSDLLEMISDVRQMLKPEILSIRPNAKLAYETICTLADKMKQHLSAEDEGLYPPLLTHEDPKVKSVAWGFINGEKPLRKMFDSYYKKWLKNCDFSFSDEFMRDTHEMLAMLETRIDREQTILLPKLTQMGLFSPPQAGR
jgi:hypothetical protein